MFILKIFFHVIFNFSYFLVCLFFFNKTGLSSNEPPGNFLESKDQSRRCHGDVLHYFGSDPEKPHLTSDLQWRRRDSSVPLPAFWLHTWLPWRPPCCSAAAVWCSCSRWVRGKTWKRNTSVCLSVCLILTLSDPVDSFFCRFNLLTGSLLLCSMNGSGGSGGSMHQFFLLHFL